MRLKFKAVLTKAILLNAILLMAVGLSSAQQRVNLTAGPSSVNLPDGSAVPMWGYTCGASVTGSLATCAALNPSAAGWSPVIITVPTGQTLQINLTNNLSFPTAGGTTPNNIPTSLVIVGQLGGGLGTGATYTPSPTHAAQPTTWPIANTGAVFNPPPQGPRVQSFGTEVAVGTPQSLTWSNMQPGTYLLESGTHPSIQGPMGLYGMVVVTTAPLAATSSTTGSAGIAYAGVNYDSDAALLFSEIDAVQNNATQTAVTTAGFSETATLGPYVVGAVGSINVVSGGSLYTSAPTVNIANPPCTLNTTTCIAAAATATIDTNPVSPTYQQVTSITVTNAGAGYISTTTPAVTLTGGTTGNVATAQAVATGALGANSLAQCSGGAAACYPPAVNYTPLYYMINGVAFDRTHASASLFAARATIATPPLTATPNGQVLLRFVNAGLRMHVPSVVGSLTSATPVAGFSLIAEDGNPLPGVPRVQSDVFMAAGKTYDVMINGPVACTPVAPATTCANPALPVFDRQLSLSGNATERDAGMLAYIGINGAVLPNSALFAAAMANPDSYSVVPGNTLSVSDPGKGVIANDINVYGVKVSTQPAHGTVTLAANGTFTYVPDSTWVTAPSGGSVTTSDSFIYQANGSGPTAIVTLNLATLEAASGITCTLPNPTYSSNVATSLSIKPPGILSFCKDGAGYPLSVDLSSGNAPVASGGMTLAVDPNGGFNATVPGVGTYTFTFNAVNSQGTSTANTSSGGSGPATVTLVFPAASNLKVSVVDGNDKTIQISDYRWIIEEDRTFYVDPNNTANTGTCTGTNCTSVPLTFGVNFHTSYMPVVAQGCTGPLSCESGQTLLGQPAVCDVGNGVCRTSAGQQTAVTPDQVHLDPTKRYYISILPGDAANPFNTANTQGGHGMGGAPIATGQKSVMVLVEPSPYQTAKLSVFVFEDDFPLNGENDAGGGVDVLSPNEPGLGGFNIQLWDDAGGTGDATGQMTYDMFNMPLSNSLAGTIDPATGFDACPIAQQATNDPTQKGITGMIVTCPRYEADGRTLSPLAGQAVVANLMPGRYGVVATPGADRIGRGEEWLQTNTLDGQKAHDSFLRIGEPSYFQEFGPAGYHVSIGFANPKIIQNRLAGVCGGTDPNITGIHCNNTVKGQVSTERMSRTPDERLYGSGSYDSFAFTQCYVSLGDPDGEDFAFTKCDSNGNFSLSGIPDGNWRITIFDQWNDMLVDGLSTPINLASGLNSTTNSTGCPGPTTSANTCDLGQVAMSQWQANIYTRTFLDLGGTGVSADFTGTPCTAPNTPQGCNANYGQPQADGLALIHTDIRYRDGSFSNRNNTDLNGYAAFNEVFPLFSWYVVETDTTRYKSTGVHVVYDAGGPADGTPGGGTSTIGKYMANTQEAIPVPQQLRVPGAVYCSNADCNGFSIANGPGSSQTGSTGRIDPPWVTTEAWQGFSGQNNFLEFGMRQFAVGETGGIKGKVVYASTRPFDDPYQLVQNTWEPLVPGVTINLYQEATAADGTQALHLVDTTKTSSWDDWAQGSRSDGIPNMNCPGQGRDTGTDADLFFFSLSNQPQWLDYYDNVLHGTATAPNTLPYNSQFKCYDGMHNWNQLQPAPYDGRYQFPSVTGLNPTTGAPAGTSCHMRTTAEPWGCIPNPDSTDWYRSGTPMLAPGKYVVEVVVPPGYELVKEEDKNILIGDNFIAPVTQQFAGLGSIFILPDQAQIASQYNSYNAQNPTQNMGATPRNDDPGTTLEEFWPCVGAARTVPDWISLYPQSNEVSPFAGATRHLCDRKEVTLKDQSSASAAFYIFTSTHVAAHFTGVITDDFTSEFDPFSPQFGEKFAPPDLPISIKDFAGNEISRTYADHWGSYDGLNYSTWEVNPPNPTGYAPTMMVVCMNDPGPILDTRPGSLTNGQMITDPLYNPAYSQFCYEIPFMPGQTQYMDTPVVPTSAFAGAGYNNPDCAYPDATPAIASVVSSDAAGPWVSAAGTGHTLTITALGDQVVNNYGYSGPQSTASPFNLKTITRHYGFGTTPGTVALVGRNGAPHYLTNVTWSDMTITGTVPNGLSACTLQQQAQYGGPSSPSQNARCGELVITAANGKQSIDSITVTIGGKAPTVLTAGQTIQSAINAAAPGDMIIVPPGTYNEMVIMWKPVRLQGIGAASSVINANTHPAGKLDPWRRQAGCLFGIAINGLPWNSTNAYDASGTYSCPGPGWNYFIGVPTNPQVDRLPLEAMVGWDANLNGNLAELLQEPTLLGAYAGAGITVLGKGVDFHGSYPWNVGSEGAFPDNTTLLTDANCGGGVPGSNGYVANPFPSNFQCNPSRIDGLTISDSSQGGGGIFAHGWNHNLEISNNRVRSNMGTLAGGISIGQGEFPGAYTVGGTNGAPGSCQTNFPNGTQEPYCFDLNVNVHHNNITGNASIGDELFSATPSGPGGIAFCTGSDYYKFNYNWLCGNMSVGDGGGLAQLGVAYNADIEHNSILFNQSLNPTIPTNGGGILIHGTPDVDPACGQTTDQDCAAPGLSDGTGPNLVINANLILGNAAESGSGGGIRLQGINGTDVLTFPNRPSRWYSARITNNIIVNNVAGWDGAGVSMVDSLAVKFVNNTVVSNDTTASAGVLFNTLGAPMGAFPTPPPNQTQNSTTSAPQPAGLVAIPNSPQLISALGTLPAGTRVTCPEGNYSGSAAVNGTCTKVSYPLLANNVFWQNRSYYIGVGALGANTLNQQNVVALYNAFTGTVPASQSTTGACVSGSSYWDIGVRGDTAPSNHTSGFTLAPTWSVLTDISDYPNLNNTGSNPQAVSQYCNGSRVPPENGGLGYQLPPGISDASVPNPIFSLLPAATVDEGNNWVNMTWGPLSLVNPKTNVTLGNYTLASTSPAIDYIPTNSETADLAPETDFFGNPRPDPASPNAFDVGAVEYQGVQSAALSVTPISLAFGFEVVGSTSSRQLLTLQNSGTTGASSIAVSVTAPFARSGGSCGTTLAAGASCTIGVVFQPTTATAYIGSVTITASVPVAGSPVSLSGTGFTVAPRSLSFTNVLIGTTSAVQNVTISNPSAATANLAIGDSLSGVNAGLYSLVAPTSGTACGSSASIAPGQSCSIGVVFHPTTTGFSPATLVITNPGSNVTVTLGGTAVGRLTISAPSPLLTTSTPDTSTKTGTITVTNGAAAPVTLTANPTVAKTGGPGAFTVTGGTCALNTTLTASGTGPTSRCTVTVTYNPNGSTATSTAHAVVSYTSTAISVTGSGTENGVSFNGN